MKQRGSLRGIHERTASPIEVRLAAFVDDFTRFIAVVFGTGDHRTMTENRPLPPRLATGDRLTLGPLDEPYVIPERTADAIAATRARGGAVIAFGTTVARALESAAHGDETVRPGAGVATGRIGPDTPIRIVDTILSGVHEPGESHFELLRAFTSDEVLHRLHDVATERQYRTHEFGDSMLIARRQPVRAQNVRSVTRTWSTERDTIYA